MYERAVTVYYAINGVKKDCNVTFVSGPLHTIDSIVHGIARLEDGEGGEKIKTIEVFNDRKESMGVFVIDSECTEFFHCNRVKEA